MNRKILYAMSFLAMIVMCGCSSEDAPAAGGGDEEVTPAEQIVLTAAQKDVVASYNQFAVKLSGRLLEGGNDNMTFSPMSITMALSMTANGAKGETLDEITSLWGMKGSDLEAINALNRRFLDVLPTLDPKAEFSLANSIWLNEGNNSILPSYNDAVAKLYDGEAFSMPFSNVKEKLNSWIERKTNGYIKDMVDGRPEGDILLANALYFHAPWNLKFEKSLTKERPFNNADGTKKDVPMMDGGDNIYTAHSDDEVVVIEVPYGNKGFLMKIMMSERDDMPLEDVLSRVYAVPMSTERCNLRMPRFEVEMQGNLVGLLKAMGLVRMIGFTGDFSAMSPNVKGFNAVQHNAKVKADEEGVTAAAATVIGSFGSAGQDVEITPRMITVDHPFVFTIEERSTGIIIMSGCIRNL